MLGKDGLKIMTLFHLNILGVIEDVRAKTIISKSVEIYNELIKLHR